MAPATGVEPFHIHWYEVAFVAPASKATVPPATVTEIGWVVKTGAGDEALLTTTVNGNTEEIPVPTNVPPFPPCSPPSAKPCRLKV